MSLIKVALVEDNTSVRESLATILNSSNGFQCVCTCQTAEEALAKLPKAAPDVVLMDINLPGVSGIECTRRLKEQRPDALIIMLTIEEDNERVFRSLEAGATGYLVKNTPPARILEAIEEVHRGGSPMSSHIARMLVRSFHKPARPASADIQLTAREEEVLSFVAQGYRSKEIADALGIGVRTIETHIRNIYEKLHVRSRAEAVARFFHQEQ
jgi:DNA-binding NarL/FixJ family response regulator